LKGMLYYATAVNWLEYARSKQVSSREVPG
jgi:hypothetical protein